MDTEPGELHVLVVDDEPEIRELLARIVLREGHQVATAESAEKALDLLPTWTFQVAFLDHRLPGMQGLLLGEYLRRNNPEMMIALVTGEDDPRLPRQSRELSIAFIEKPFDVAEIVSVLERYQEEEKERRERRLAQQDEDFAPPLSRFADELAEHFRMPKVPNRVSSRLVDPIKRSLSNLRSKSRYTERDRMIALSGLLTAKVLGMDLPRTSSGLTLFEEYDRLMQDHGRRTEFGGSD